MHGIEAIRELTDCMLVESILNNKKIGSIVEQTKKQKEILKALNIKNVPQNIENIELE